MSNSPEKLAIRSKDGVSSQVNVYAREQENAATIICMPAMGVAARHYDKMAKVLSGFGWNVVTTDLRGNGESQIRPSRSANFGFYEMLAYDWPAIVNVVANRFPKTKTAILGHSLGAQLSALYLSRAEHRISALVMVAAPWFYFRGWDFPRNLNFLLYTQMARLVAAIVGYFPGRRFGVGGNESRTVVKDWARVVRTGRWKLYNDDYDYETQLSNLSLPALAVSFSDDTFGPKRAVDNYCKKMPAADITRRHLHPQDLERREMGHMGLLNAPPPLLEMISDWLFSKLADRQNV